MYRFEATELLVAPEGNSAGVSVHHNGRRLNNPHAVSLAIGNDGRRDVPSSAFDRQEPIVFDFAAPIIEISHRATKPDGIPYDEMMAQVAQSVGASEPRIEVSGSTLRIGPSLLASRQIVVLSLLTDGEPRVSISSPLIDVRVVNNREVLKRRRRFTRALRAVALVVAAISVALPVASAPRLGFAVPLVVFGAFLVLVSLMADWVTTVVVGRAMAAVDNSA
ncbi:hypothetical protein [Micromonospora sp. NPDC049301]|uniref:hypothetical protein n=1 Tax=Micromonospora sp. NPDC049301 TaxID=3155723 RepID=UPI003432C1C7